MNLNLDRKVDKIDVVFNENNREGVRVGGRKCVESPPANLSIEAIFIAMALQTIYTNVFYMISFPTFIRKISRAIDTHEKGRQGQELRCCLINVPISYKLRKVMWKIELW